MSPHLRCLTELIMNLPRTLMLCVTTMASLVACGPDPAPKDPSPPPPVKNAFSDMTGTMDKARGVEATTMQHKEDMDRTLQETEGH
jgi:hypothetical protein